MNQQLHKADFFTVLSDADKTIQCDLCPHHCVLTTGKIGICLVRQNIDGILYSLNYCRPVSTAIDPIEKKPLYHFYPGSHIYSTGPSGCTLKCLFCQNCEISQTNSVTAREIPALSIANECLQSKTIGIAYTYAEPYTWYETIMDVGRIVREHGLKNVVVTNGYMESAPLRNLLSLVDAMNIDIKSMRQSFYKNICKGDLEPVLRSCEIAKKHCHIEITNLLIPGENDTEKDISDLVDFIATNLGKDTPLHFSRYFPRYKMNVLPTSQESLVNAKCLAETKLAHVYIGNTNLENVSDTYCPSCKQVLIQRSGYKVTVKKGFLPTIKNGFCICPHCQFTTNVLG